MPFAIHKVVSALPGSLEPDAVYLVRTGAGFDLYVSDATGSVAHQVNVATHSHAISGVTGLQAALDAKLTASLVSAFALTLLDDTTNTAMRTTLGLGSLATLSAVANGHVTNARLATVPTGTMKGRVTAATGAPEDLTPTQVKTLLALGVADITGLQAALDAKAAASHTHTWDSITGKPLTFAPATHTHSWNDLTDRPTIPEAGDVFAWRGQWANATVYAEGDVVRATATVNEQKRNFLMICIVAHTSTFGTMPPGSPIAAGDTYNTPSQWQIMMESRDGLPGESAVVQSFATDAEAEAYSTANPTHIVFSREA